MSASHPSLPVRLADGLLEASVIGSFSRVGPSLRSRLFGWGDPPRGALTGRTALVTGATSGIGAALAAGLVEAGATVHVVGRDRAKLDRTAADLRRRAGGDRVVPHLADLARLDDVRALADVLADTVDRLDVLAHVAGALVHERTTTTDGVELTLQVHVVAPFLLTHRLLPLLSAADDPRVLTMSSGGMYTQRLDVEELIDPPQPFDGTVAYARAKRAQVELNRLWADRHRYQGIGFHALHPGWVDTPGLDAGLPSFARWVHPILRSPEQGADTALWLAWTPEATAPGGSFWHDRRPRHTVALPWTATPAGEAERLWSAVAALAGVPNGRARVVTDGGGADG